MVYTGLLYQDLIKSGVVSEDQKLPPVFPVVIYNGEPKWTAATDIAELIEPLHGNLAAYRPSQKCYVLDEGRVETAGTLPSDNTLSDIIRLELSPEPEAIRPVVSEVIRRLKDPKYDSLRRAIAVWINRVVLSRLVPQEPIPEVQDLQEIDAMLAERVVQWTEKLMEEGRQEGRQEGEATLLERLLTRLFGHVSEETRARLATATPEQLEHWAENILEAKSLDAVFAGH